MILFAMVRSLSSNGTMESKYGGFNGRAEGEFIFFK